MKELPRRGPIGVKRMGELNSRPFFEAVKRRYNEVDAEQIASELCSLWEEYLRDPEWHPIKVVAVNGKHKVCFFLFWFMTSSLFKLIFTNKKNNTFASICFSFYHGYVVMCTLGV